MSAVGTGQLLIPPPPQEQAAVGKANTENIATTEPIRHSIPTLQSITARFRQRDRDLLGMGNCPLTENRPDKRGSSTLSGASPPTKVISSKRTSRSFSFV